MAEHRCSNCNARIHFSTYLSENGQCGLCSSSESVAKNRHRIMELQKAKGIDDPHCAKCGVSESQRFQQLEQAEEQGIFVYGIDYPALLYCEHCDKYFCGKCQVDLGMNAGCPQCRNDLEH